MKIKVISCSNKILWYNSHIGKEFEVQKEEPNAYWCLEPDMRFRCLNWILKSDAEITQEKELT